MRGHEISDCDSPVVVLSFIGARDTYGFVRTRTTRHIWAPCTYDELTRSNSLSSEGFEDEGGILIGISIVSRRIHRYSDSSVHSDTLTS